MLLGFHVTKTTVFVLAGKEDIGFLYAWRRDESFKFIGVLDVTGHRYNWLDGFQETLVLSSKTSIHFWNPSTNKKTSFNVKYQVFPSTAKVEGGMLFIEQGGHTMSVYDVAVQEYLAASSPSCSPLKLLFVI